MLKTYNDFYEMNGGFYKSLYEANIEKFKKLFGDDVTIDDVNLFDEFLYFNYGNKPISDIVINVYSTFNLTYKQHIADMFYMKYYKYLQTVKENINIEYNPLNSKNSKTSKTENATSLNTDKRVNEKTDYISAFDSEDFSNDRQYKDENKSENNSTVDKMQVVENSITDKVASDLIRKEIDFRKNNQFIDIFNDVIMSYLTLRIY